MNKEKITGEDYKIEGSHQKEINLLGDGSDTFTFHYDDPGAYTIVFDNYIYLNYTNNELYLNYAKDKEPVNINSLINALNIMKNSYDIIKD